MSEQSFLEEAFVSIAKGSFHGGIHPAQHKLISNQRPIESIKMPPQLVLPLRQSSGQVPYPIIAIGENVIKGQLIADSISKTSSRLHSPACGFIEKIENYDTNHSSGLLEKVIIIRSVEGEDTQSSTLNDWKNKSKEQLLEIISGSGIVGLGGATFPTAFKLSAEKIHTLIINAMECEPYITCDDRLIQEQSESIIIGAQIAASIVSAKKIIFAIEDNKPLAIKALCASVNNLSLENQTPVEVVIAPTIYPSGGEKQTIELVLSQQVPQGKRPSSIGVLVQNVATMSAIHQAVILNKTLTKRLVTITGNLVTTPGNYWIPFGTTIEYLIDYFSIDKSRLTFVTFGGPLMGQNYRNYDIPTTKSTNCIIFNSNQTQEKPWVIEPKNHPACIRCSDCENVCPANLLPQQLYWFSQTEQLIRVENQGLFDCIECGACSYVCPSEIPLVQYFRFAKSSIKNEQKKTKIANNAKRRFEFREMRLQREKEERAQKHIKAAEERKRKALDQNADPSGNKTAINAALERVKRKKIANQPIKNGIEASPKEQD